MRDKRKFRNRSFSQNQSITVVGMKRPLEERESRRIHKPNQAAKLGPGAAELRRVGFYLTPSLPSYSHCLYFGINFFFGEVDSCRNRGTSGYSRERIDCPSFSLKFPSFAFSTIEIHGQNIIMDGYIHISLTR